MKSLKEKVSLSIDSDIIQKIRDYAEEDDRSVSSYINLLLREHIRVKEDKK